MFAGKHSKTQSKPYFSMKNTLNHMPWAIIPFILSLFILVEAIELSGLTKEIGNFLRDLSLNSTTIYTYLFGFLSAISANFLNNIPMSVAFVPIISEASVNGLQPAIFATIIGSNLGANITPLGALAGIMWIGILKNKDYNIKFSHFLKYGLIVTPFCLFMCLGILSLEFLIF
jgi:arsenical pump membrane protein